MKKYSSLLSLLLISAMLLGLLASCTSAGTNISDSSAGLDDEVIESSSTSTPENDDEKESEGGKDDTDSPSEGRDNVLPLVEHANSLTNAVNAYFEQVSNRSNVIIENQNITLNYGVSSFADQKVNYLNDKNGNTYVENTFDVFVKMTNGNTFYASKTNKNTTMNLYRFGYYMYEVRLEEQNFYNGIQINDSFVIENLKPKGTNSINAKLDKEGTLSAYVTEANDPFINLNVSPYSADDYKFIEITIKSEAKATRSAHFYYQRANDSNFKSDQLVTFYLDADGEYHTYHIPLNTATNYDGTIKGLRLDLDAQAGEQFHIKEIKIINGDDGGAPDLSLARSFYAYSDKLHHVSQVVAHTEVNNISEIGMVTKISADTVAKLIVKDGSNELHTSLEDVNWESAEYIGFDIISAGIFGYILPKDSTSGRLSVTLEDGYYVIIQTRTPENGTIIPSEEKTLNANDFYMGQRIYTDSSHTFDDFLFEAYCERNPLSAQRFKIDYDKSIADANAVGYDPLRGAYKFTLEGAKNFAIPQNSNPNKHYNVSFTVRGDELDRKVYVYTSTNSGNLECAVLLDESDMMLPIPLEVGKNFSEAEGERNIYNIDDDTYGEVIFPMIIGQNEKLTYTVVHLYQNWGKYPLKQISWIQFHAPYYHLSTGTTETNCIMPYYATKNGKASLQMLPDHRAWSAPLWAGDPQHTSGGSHTMLSYTDSNGLFFSSDNSINVVGAYGPTYADVTMYHTSDDGKIKYTINHMEMPQTDENRGYYEFKYEVLEDLTIKNFKQDFSFYSVTDNAGSAAYYKRLGYLNENNECTVVNTNMSAEPAYYVLGNESPYFDYFDMANCTSANGYVNLSFLVYNYEFIIGGEKSDANFVVKDYEKKAYLSLDLGEVTLKAGDTFTINAIIMPWGSQESEYPVDAPDYNVRDVRENTLLDPVIASPVENCQTIDSVYLPKVLSTDGKSATFTLSGGENNTAVRVYGFDKLTAPKIYEKIGDEWVEYVVNSSETPDKMGNYHYYDGYNVYYDGDGKYSYSFIVTMDDGAPRTFKVEAHKDFEPWPEIDDVEIPDPIDLYLDPKEISEVIVYHAQFSAIELGYEDFDYISFYGNSHVPTLTESFFYAYQDGTAPTGGLLVLKYRLPESNPDKITNIEFYLSTDKPAAKGSEDSYWVSGGIIPDGEWHVLIVDVASFGKSAFVVNGDGEYVPQYIRVDPFNTSVSKDTRMDIAFIGMADTREEIYELCTDLDSITLCKNNSTNLILIDPKTGEVISGNDGGGTTPSTPPTPSESLDLLLDPDKINATIDDRAQFANIVKNNDGSFDYLSLYGNSHKDFLNESYFYAYKGGTATTGGYLALKYRLPSTNAEKVNNVEFYVSTANDIARDSSDSYHISGALVNDGEWHVMIIDLASFGRSTFAKDSDGNYVTKYIRVDPYNSKFSSDTRFDIAYIAMADTLQELIAYNSDLETVTVCRNDQQTHYDYDTATGKPVGDVIILPSTVKMFYSGASLKSFAEGNRGKDIGKVTLSEDGSYTTFSSKSGAGESYVFFHHNTTGGQELGQYLFIKYRTSLTGERFEIYASCQSADASNSSMLTVGTPDRGYLNDGEWHMLIIDLSTISGYTDKNGKYYPMHIRFDIFNTKQTTDSNTLDIAYIGVGTSISDILTIEEELGEAMVYAADGLSSVAIEGNN